MMKRIAEAILTVMVVGLIGNGLVMWKDQGVQDERIASSQDDILELKSEDKEQRKMIRQMHYLMIKSKNVDLPEELK